MAAMATQMGQMGGPQAPAAPAPPSNEVVEINDLLDKTKCYCLNEKDGSFGNLFIGMADLTLKSDADEQLLMQFAFKDTVRLHSLNIAAPIDDSAPQTVKVRGASARARANDRSPWSRARFVPLAAAKVFVNRQDMGFDDCEHTEARRGFGPGGRERARARLFARASR